MYPSRQHVSSGDKVSTPGISFHVSVESCGQACCILGQPFVGKTCRVTVIWNAILKEKRGEGEIK